MQPSVTFDSKNEKYVLTLWREKVVVHEFKSFSVTINDTGDSVINGYSSVIIGIYDAETMDPKHMAQMDAPAIDGQFYCICAVPFQGEDLLIQLSKEEFDVLDPIMHDIDEERYEAQEYEFTRTTLKDMAKNPSEYGPGMRALAGLGCPVCGEALSGSVYRPHCSECTWDSDAAYREHPLDHE